MNKNVITLLILLLSINIINAGEIVKEDHATIYIYGAIEETIYMSGMMNEKFDYNKSVCINATVIEGEISIISSKEYDLEYTFIAELNDTDYISKIVILKQEILSSSWITGIVLKRTLKIDGIEIANYETRHSKLLSMKHNTFYWNLEDNNIRYGDKVYDNHSLAFTQLNYQDQQDFLPQQILKTDSVTHKYISVGIGSNNIFELTGLTGIIYNAIGWLPKNIGDSIQNLIFMPLAILQYTFDFIFTFLFLIINNWWYAILLLEILCIFPALKYTNYADMIQIYISTHISIFKFLYEVVILNIIHLIFRIIEIVRNIFRI